MRRIVLFLLATVALAFALPSRTQAQVSPLDGYWWDISQPYCTITNPIGFWFSDIVSYVAFGCWELDYTLPEPIYFPPVVPPDPNSPPPVPPQDPPVVGAPTTDIGRAPAADAHGCGGCVDVGNPINAATLNKYQREIDFVGTGALPLRVERHYNSLFADAPANLGEFGQGWTSNFGERLVAITFPDPNDPSAPFEAVLQNETGYRYKIVSDDHQYWYTSEGRPVNFGWDEDKEIFAFVDDGLRKIFLKSGELDSITHPNGETLRYHYDVSVAPSRLFSVTHSSGASLTFDYDAAGRIKTITDPSTEVYQYFYDTPGNLRYVLRPNEDASTSKVDYHYEDPDLPNALTGISHEWDGVMRRHSTYAYVGQGFGYTTGYGAGEIEPYTLEHVTDPTFTVRRVTNPSGKVFTYVFDSDAGMPRIKEIAGAPHGGTAATIETFTYDANGHYDLVTDAEGNVTDYDYNARGQLLAVTTGAGTADARTVSYAWDDMWNRVTRITTPLLVTDIELDSAGLPDLITATNKSAYGIADQTRIWDIVTERYADGVIQRQTVYGPRYDAANGVDIPDNTIREFDSIGRLMRVKRQVSAAPDVFLETTFTAYDAYGRVGRITYPSGLIEEYDYHPRGYVLEAREIVGSVTRSTVFDYYESGDLKRVTFPDGSIQDFDYDAARRLTQTTRDDADADGNDVRWRKFIYDNASNLITDEIWEREIAEIEDPYCRPNPWEPCGPYFGWVDALVYDMDFEYDALDRLKKQNFERAYHDVEYGYDLDGRLAWTKDGYDRLTSLTYTPNGTPDTTTYRDGGVSDTSYDANGNVDGIRDALGEWTWYRRDGFGQAWQIDSPATGTSFYDYDEAGNLIRTTDARGVVLDYEYDLLGRLERVSTVGTALETFTYDTDRPGFLYRMTDAAGSHTFLRNEAGELLSRASDLDGVTLTTGYSYDAFGRLRTITYPSGVVATYHYNSFGEVARISVAGGGVTPGDVVRDVEYYPWGGLRDLEYGNGESRTWLRDEDYTLWRLISGSRLYSTYIYDFNGNLTSFDGRSMSYDAMDRLKTHSGPDGSHAYGYDLNGNRRWHDEAGVQTSYHYDASASRLQSLTGGVSETRSYDASGNTTAIDGSRFFDHDDPGRYWRYREGAATVSYAHNAFGERQLKDDGTTTTRFVYDGANLLHEDNGSTQRDYVYLGGELVGLVQGGAVYFVHADHLGRPQLVTDGARSLVWQAENNAFDSVPGADLIGGLNIGFPGQYYDLESGLWYNYFRTYDPTTGRYLESDPIGLAGGLNTYAYAGGNPVTNVDPYGLFEGPWKESRARDRMVRDGDISVDEQAEICRADAVGGLIGIIINIPGPEDAVLAGIFGWGARLGTGTTKAIGGIDDAVPNRTVIGKVDDIQPEKLGPGETNLLDRLPDQGSPKANWKQNSGVLRQEVRKGQPIRDASVDSAGNLRDNTGFLRAERNLLENQGWKYDPSTQTWNPPGPN